MHGDERPQLAEQPRMHFSKMQWLWAQAEAVKDFTASASTIEGKSYERHQKIGSGIAMSLIARNVTIDGRRTSMRLEPLMWSALNEIAHREGMRVNALISRIAAQSTKNLSSDVRSFVAGYYRAAATEAGHAAAGHGFGNPLANGGHPVDAAAHASVSGEAGATA
ncbi:putative DNA-binding ribbon-helix-helix protein [Azospirillum agricola]|uniref:ribbon-helix-helix domain-containing protein n=1 Tax=Azospirillum agricola TaxID=1720247 RepID=UPI001F20D6E4|nr:ribbon-helix-helix domain-containing protein [Azospirillum agricola]MBP2230795.1 putative DNA-binding ribbon-helix-helix protein [Azospirillum agricola]